MAANLAIILVNLSFKFGREIDKSSSYMKFGRNLVINDYQVRVFTNVNRKVAVAILAAILIIIHQKLPIFEL